MAELHVSKKSIGKLFSEMQNKKFIIPDFQRPYKWYQEKCETLWEDIVNFTNTDAKKGSDYFLGTIVSYTDSKKNQEIIDGQQRITSFFLLLRAFYKKLESMNENDQVKGLKNQLAPCIWDIDPISQIVTDSNAIHIESLVATEQDNETFHNILRTGETDKTAKDNYSVNYRYFKKVCDEYAESHPLEWKQLCITILSQCIILPIECDTSETALTIFSTLNDRGLPLADSDIFKAQIYRSKTSDDERSKFTQSWKDLSLVCEQAYISIDEVFRYYSHVLRGRNGDKSKEVGLRRFYSEANYTRLKDDYLMEEIMALANFWRFLNAKIVPDNNLEIEINDESRKYAQCLSLYPNDFWRYATSVFFIKNMNSENFEEHFESFLKELLAYLFVRFIQYPSVNAIKSDIYSSCISLIESNELTYRINFDEKILSQDLDEHHSSRISRALLLLNAYLFEDQEKEIHWSFDIEHIFPKKWQNTNYNGWGRDDANAYLDRLGNKIVFEKKLNIQAGNGYFGRKKLKYAESNIKEIVALSNYPKDDWLKEDIEKREEDLKKRLILFFKKNLES